MRKVVTVCHPRPLELLIADKLPIFALFVPITNKKLVNVIGAGFCAQNHAFL
jgi:hypothetical protein